MTGDALILLLHSTTLTAADALLRLSPALALVLLALHTFPRNPHLRANTLAAAIGLACAWPALCLASVTQLWPATGPLAWSLDTAVPTPTVWVALPGLLWAAVALWMLARLAMGMAAAGGCIRRSRPAPDHAVALLCRQAAALGLGDVPALRVTHSEDSAPLGLYGLRKRVILIPEPALHWPERQLRAALAHELAHHARGDLPLQLAAQILWRICWPNPLLRMLVQRWLAERELACDQIALHTGVLPSDLAATLLQAARPAACHPATQLAAHARGGLLRQRILRLVDPQTPAPGNRAGRAASMALAAAAFGSLILLLPPPADQSATASTQAESVEAPAMVGAPAVQAIRPARPLSPWPD